MKKIAVGGAAAVGASTVISSPAFAFDLPTQATAPTFGAPALSTPPTTATITQSGAGVGSCNESATGGSTAPTGVIQSFAIVSYSLGGVGSKAVIISSSSTQVVLQKQNAANTPVNFQQSDTVTFSATVRYTCAYGTGSPVTTLDKVNTYVASATGVALQ
jgi:hypothetical protein